jgi:peptidyl-prolyl cis-trans isomerase D
MFDFVRNHTRLMLALMVLLIIPSFVFFGVQGYTRFTDASQAAVAKVDGRSITRAEWEQAHQRQVERMRRQMPGLDSKVFDNPQLKRETLDQMVRERVLLAAANTWHLYPSRERLVRLFDADPQLAALRGPDGKISRDALAAQGLTPEAFDQQLRQEFGMRQVVGGVAGSALAPAAAASASLGAFFQQREVQLQRFDPASYAAKVSPSDAAIEAYYKANEAQLRAPEQATIEYIVLDHDAVTKDLVLSEEDLMKYYAENASRYTAAEERRVSHILIKAEKEMPPAERQKAKARAEGLLAELRRNPKAFAELARKNSQDPGSAERGGDLDFFGRGAMVKPFEDAAFAMKEGEISAVIETDFGYHVLQLTGARGGDKKPFEAVRAEIEAEVRKQQASKRFAEKAEQFTDAVYQQPDSLQPAIDKFNLTKKTATVQRQAAPGATGVLASQKLLDAVFSGDAIGKKYNTAAIEAGPNQLVSARIVQHTPARTLPLAEVKDRVRERVVRQQATALARKDGAARLAAVKASPAEALPTAATLSRGQPQGQPRSVVEAVLAADATKLPAVIGIDAGDDGYVVAKVVRVLPREASPGGDSPLLAQYTQAWADAEARAYLVALNKRFKANIDEAAAAAAAASAATP